MMEDKQAKVASGDYMLDNHPFFSSRSADKNNAHASTGIRLPSSSTLISRNISKSKSRDNDDKESIRRAQSRERHYGLQLEQLEKMTITAGPSGDEESAHQEAALARLRSFMKGMGE